MVDLNLVHAAIFTLANVGEWSGRVAYLLGFAARPRQSMMPAYSNPIAPPALR
jgi:hypothetical protein